MFIGRIDLIRVLAFALLLAGQAPPLAADGDTLKLTHIRAGIDWKPDTTYAGFFVARERGFFARHGLDVDIQEGNGALTTAAVVGTNHDLSISSASAEATAIARASGIAVKSVSVLFQRVPTVFYSRATNAVRKPSDLVGKRIGLVAGSVGVGQFLTVLSRNDIAPERVTVIYTGTDPAPVLSGQLDAMQSYEEAEALQLRLQGKHIEIMRLADYGLSAYGLNIIASDQLITDKPKLVAAFVAAVREGYAFVRDHPEEAADIYSKLFPEHEAAYVRASIKIVASHLGHDVIGVQSRDRWARMLEDLAAAHLLKKPVSVDDVVAAGFDPEVPAK